MLISKPINLIRLAVKNLAESLKLIKFSTKNNTNPFFCIPNEKNICHYDLSFIYGFTGL